METETVTNLHTIDNEHLRRFIDVYLVSSTDPAK